MLQINTILIFGSWNATVLNMDNNNDTNVSWTANQHIRMISVGECYTEDWSNDVENSALNTNKLNFKIYSNRKQLFYIVKIFHNITVFAVFWINNAGLVSRRGLFKNIKKKK